MSKITDSIKLLQADTLVMFTKLHNYHWNIKGIHFFELHTKTEEFYNLFSTMYDDLAERLLQLGEKPIVTLKNSLEVARITEDENTQITAQYLMSNLAKDFEFFFNEFKNLSDISDSDPTTQAYAQDQMAFFEKELWMIKASLV